MCGFIFPSMFTGSLLGAGADFFAVWTWILAAAEPDGTVKIIPKILAAEIGMPLRNVNTEIAFLSARDPFSKSLDEGGRRIVPISGYWWRIVNYAHYRSMAEAEDRGQ